MKKILSLLSAAVIALSASALTVTAAETQDEVTYKYEYLADEDNLLWQDSGFAAYKDTVYEGFTSMNAVIFKTVPGINIEDLPELPEKYSIQEMVLNLNNGLWSRWGIKVDSQEETDEVAGIMKKWLEQGLIIKAELYKSYDALNLVGTGTLRINVSLKSDADIDGFLSDNQNLDFKILSYSAGGYSSKYIGVDSIKETIDALRTDSRVESAKIIADIYMPMATHEHRSELIGCLTDGYISYAYVSDGNAYQLGDANMDSVINIYDVISVARFLLDPSSMTETEQKAADINQDGKINLYDAIGIAKIII